MKKQVAITKKAKNNLLALGSTAVLAVYLAGYFRTRSAAQRFEGEAAGRRLSVAPAVVAATALVTSKPVPAATNPPPAPAHLPPPPEPAVAVLPAPAPSSPLQIGNQKSQIANSTPPPTATNAGVSPVTNVIAATMATPAKPIDATPAKWKDGKFSGWGSCRHGDIEATVEIKDGRIVSAIISTCRTRYDCDVIDMIVPQVVARQSADVDTVSGATQSADAFYGAVTAALLRAKPDPAKAM